jgi:HAD superfamily hydrolase (TIGR01490 family)
VTKAAAFFDLDKTIIAKSATLAFGRPLYKAGFLKRGMLVKAGIAQIAYTAFGADHDQLDKVKEQLSTVTRGWDAAELRRLATEAMDEVVSPLVYQEAIELIGHHRESDRKVVIISTSPEEIVAPLAQFLGGIDHVIATRSEIGPDGKYTGELEFYAYGENKASALKEYAAEHDLDLSESFAYSDSVTDLPMMRAVGHPVAVNPDKDLEKAARAAGWEIRVFDKPVSMGERLAVYKKPAEISGAAIGVGAVVLWLLNRRRKHSHSS